MDTALKVGFSTLLLGETLQGRLFRILPSLPWWGWLLSFLGAGTVFVISTFLTRVALDNKNISRIRLGLLVAIPSLAISSLSLLIVVTRIVKWVWNRQ